MLGGFEDAERRRHSGFWDTWIMWSGDSRSFQGHRVFSKGYLKERTSATSELPVCVVMCLAVYVLYENSVPFISTPSCPSSVMTSNSLPMFLKRYESNSIDHREVVSLCGMSFRRMSLSAPSMRAADALHVHRMYMNRANLHRLQSKSPKRERTHGAWSSKSLLLYLETFERDSVRRM